MHFSQSQETSQTSFFFLLFRVIMLPSIRFLLHFWLWFLCIGTLGFKSCGGEVNVGCLEIERQALIHFKRGLTDPSNRLSSWVGDDCCTWTGIHCNNKTGHVVKLSLRGPFQVQPPSPIYNPLTYNDEIFEAEFKRSSFSGELNSYLLELKYLKHLDLSMNSFGGISIPKFIGSFNNLRYLNISCSGFGGRVPHELGNLSSLRYLDLNNRRILSVNSSDKRIALEVPVYHLHVERLHWLSRLSSLQYLDMKRVDLSMATDWVSSINMLPFISDLHLTSCQLPNISTSLLHVNLTSLSTLVLSSNSIGPEIPAWIFNNSRMVSLDLGYNQLTYPISTALGNLCNLQTLNLEGNDFGGTEINRLKEPLKGCIKSSLEDLKLENNGLTGHLPGWLGQFTNLKSLDVYHNSLSGPIPPSLGRLSSLEELVLAHNSFSGSIPHSLGTLSSLRVLGLRTNSLSGTIPPSLGTLSSLRALDLSSNSLSGSIPPSLGSLSSLEELYLNDNQLNGSIPESLGQLSHLVSLDLGNNSFEGALSEVHFSNLIRLKQLDISSTSLVFNVSSNWVPPFQLIDIIMDDCKLGPQFPPWFQTQTEISSLSLSNTSISDVIPNFLWNLSSNIYYLDLSSNSIFGSINIKVNLVYLSLSSNRLEGSIPLAICQMKDLTYLSLSNNQLSGEIPQCLGDLQFLTTLILNENALSGGIPRSISHLSRLISLHLENNNLTGELPPSMKNCTELVTLDLGENNFSGNIPKWIGESLPLLKFLILRSNMFDGNLPPELSLLSKLQVLDLSQNSLSGAMPESFGNFSAMAETNKENEVISNSPSYFATESISVSWKGFQYEYSSTISLVININLACNDLHGEIPTGITRLFGLQSLNLSKNHLTGRIPENIGDLRWIESIDLSLNQLSGMIPHSLSNLTSLSYLNLSYNSFSGRIPSSNQLDTINDSSIYMGNPLLCGPPLLNQCPGDETFHDSQPVFDGEEEVEDELIIQLFYISMAPGFVVGFWVVCGTLLFKRSWRVAYYRFFDKMGDWLYVMIARKVDKFKKSKGLRGNRGQPSSPEHVHPHALPLA